MIRKQNKVAIIGPYPLPYGGISVHIQRILTTLPEESYVFYNISRSSSGVGKKFFGIYKYYYLLTFLFINYKVIHYHSTSTKVRVLLSLIGLVKPNIYLHLHGESYTDTIGKHGVASFILRKTLPKINILASNSLIIEKLKAYKPKSIIEIDAFIPPEFKQNIFSDVVAKIPTISTKYVISMVGWFHRYKEQDLYGFDISLDALNILRNNLKIDVSLIASINGVRDHTMFNAFLARRKELGLEDSFILIEESLEEVYPLLLVSHVFIRPTNTDGNSVSVKEALWFGCQVIASDAVVRPKGVILFANRDSNDLANKIALQIANINFLPLKDRLNNIQSSKFIHPLVSEVYKLDRY